MQSIGFKHDVVNHSEGFVSSDKTIHTQNIENLWRCMRRFLNKKGTYTRVHLIEYIDEFIFRKLFANVFECLITAIQENFAIRE